MNDEGGLGSVVAFAGATLEPVAGAKVTATAMFKRYRTWCAREKFVPLRMADFFHAFDTLAAELHIPKVGQGANVVYRDIGWEADPADQPGTETTGEGTDVTD